MSSRGGSLKLSMGLLDFAVKVNNQLRKIN
jgi:hypothetical protein